MSAPLRIAALLLSVFAAACSSTNNGNAAGSSASVPDFAAGAHAVRMSGDSAGNDGAVFTAANGAAYMVLGNDSNVATAVVYRRDGAGSSWRRVPAAAEPTTLGTQLDDVLSLTPLSLPASDTMYRAWLGGAVRTFTLSPKGDVLGNQNGCWIIGRLATSALTGTLHADLRLFGCGQDGHYVGVAYVDPEAPNAVFRVVADDGNGILDFFVSP